MQPVQTLFSLIFLLIVQNSTLLLFFWIQIGELIIPTNVKEANCQQSSFTLPFFHFLHQGWQFAFRFSYSYSYPNYEGISDRVHFFPSTLEFTYLLG